MVGWQGLLAQECENAYTSVDALDAVRAKKSMGQYLACKKHKNTYKDELQKKKGLTHLGLPSCSIIIKECAYKEISLTIIMIGCLILHVITIEEC